MQTYLTSRLTHYLSKELKANVFIKAVDISWFLDVELKGVYISDQHKETLLFTRSLIVDVDQLHYRSKTLNIKSITLNDANITLRRYPSDSSFNYQFLVDYFSSTDTTSTPSEKKWKLNVKSIELKNSRLQYHDDHEKPVLKGFDYNHVVLTGFDLKLADLLSKNDTLSATINQLALHEKCGFSINKLNTRLQLTPTKLQLKDLQLRTGNSNIETDLTLSYPDISAFSDFVNQVTINAYLLPSDIDVKDLVYFVPEMSGMNERVVVEGEVQGKINKLKLNDFQCDYGTFSRFSGNIRLNGLPVIDETYIQMTIKDFVTNHYDLNSFTLPGGTRIAIPEQVTMLGNIRVKGKFTGFYNDFVSYAEFSSDVGSIFTDVSVKNNSESGQLEYSGKVRTHEFNLGLLTNQQDYIGKINLTADLTGSGTTLDDLLLNLDGTIDSLYLKGNNFKEIRISGGISDRRFNGSLTVTDQRLGLDFDGFVDFKKDHPIFDFVTNINHAWLNQLNLVKSDSIMGFKTSMKIHFEGIDPDSITGKLSLDSTVFRMNRSVFIMKHLSLAVEPEHADSKNITLTSDYADAHIQGSFAWDQLIPSMKQVICKYFPALGSTDKPQTIDHQPNLTFSVNLKDTRPFSRMFFPGITLANNTLIDGTYNPVQNIINLKAGAKTVNLFGTTLSEVHVEGSANGNKLNLNTGCDHADMADNIGLDNFVFTINGKNDTLNYKLGWKNENLVQKNTGNLEGYLAILTSDNFNFHLNRSSTVINDSLWVIPDANLVEIDSQAVRIQNLEFISGDEKISLNGVVSDNPLDELTVNFQGFDLSNIDFLTIPSGFDFDGIITGKMELMNLLEAPNLISDIIISRFTVNKDMLGNMNIHTNWDPSLKALFAKAEVIYRGNIGENKPLSVQGYYYPEKTDNCLDFAIHIDNFKLKTISNFLSSFSSKFTGFATGDLTLKGNFLKPDLEGKFKVQRGVIRVDYLKTEYSFSQEFEMGKNYIGFNNVIAYDSLGNKLIINGKINHNYFYDFSVDLTLKLQNLLVMNTQSYDNDLFYGKALGTGEVKIHGPVDNIVIDIVAKSEKGTQINLPINTTADISDNEFITFENSEQDTNKMIVVAPPDLTGVTLNLDLEATPDGIVKIFMPDDMGTIKATGKGKLKVGVDTRGQFLIYGDYQVNEGSFLFTLQNVVNRLFQIQPGGNIKFSGDPYDTKVDLRAIYKLDVPPTGLRLTDQQTQAIKKIPVECIIDLKGNIFNPDLTFKIATPEKDPEINQIIFSQLDTNNQQQMSEQLIFLMVLKQFKPIESTNSLDVKSSVGSSSWDVLSNQLNSWLSRISKDFDIGVNYKPGDRLTSDELTVALSTQLFNDRVIVDGNFGYNSNMKNPTTTTQNTSNLVGDVKVDVKITNDGRFRVRAYNKSNNVALFENNAPYTQGVGVFFRKEFDNFTELIKGKKKKSSIKPDAIKQN